MADLNGFILGSLGYYLLESICSLAELHRYIKNESINPTGHVIYHLLSNTKQDIQTT